MAWNFIFIAVLEPDKGLGVHTSSSTCIWQTAQLFFIWLGQKALTHSLLSLLFTSYLKKKKSFNFCREKWSIIFSVIFKQSALQSTSQSNMIFKLQDDFIDYKLYWYSKIEWSHMIFTLKYFTSERENENRYLFSTIFSTIFVCYRRPNFRKKRNWEGKGSGMQKFPSFFLISFDTFLISHSTGGH